MSFINNLLFVKCYSSLKVFHSDAQQRRISYLVLWPLFRLWLRVVNCVASSNMKQWDNSRCQTPSDWHFCAIVVLALDADQLKFSVRGNLSRVHTPLDVPAAVNPAAFPALSNRFPAVEEMLCEERSACLCSMFTSHLLCVCLPRTWAITAHYGDNYLDYNLSYFLRKTSTALCAHHGATSVWKKTKCRFLRRARVSYRKRLVHHICHDYRCTFCNRPAALLLLFFFFSF